MLANKLREFRRGSLHCEKPVSTIRRFREQCFEAGLFEMPVARECFCEPLVSHCNE